MITEIGVFEKSDMLHAVIYPDYQKAKTLGIENVEEMLKWDVIDKYNQKVTPYKKVMKFSLIKEPLPRTRLLKLKRFLLPKLEMISKEKLEVHYRTGVSGIRFNKRFFTAAKRYYSSSI